MCELYNFNYCSYILIHYAVELLLITLSLIILYIKKGNNNTSSKTLKEKEEIRKWHSSFQGENKCLFYLNSFCLQHLTGHFSSSESILCSQENTMYAPNLIHLYNLIILNTESINTFLKYLACQWLS